MLWKQMNLSEGLLANEGINLDRSFGLVFKESDARSIFPNMYPSKVALPMDEKQFHQRMAFWRGAPLLKTQ